MVHQHLRHLGVVADRALPVPCRYQCLHQQQVTGLVIGVQLADTPADPRGFGVAAHPQQLFRCDVAQLQIPRVVVGPVRHRPGTAHGIGQQVSAVELNGEQGLLHVLRSLVAVGVKPLRIQLQLDVRSPGINSPAVLDHVLAVFQPQPVLHGGPRPMEQSLHGVARVQIRIPPQGLYDLILTHRPVVKQGHIF